MSQGKRILLVEDDETLGYLLSEYLRIKDFQVVWAKNGKEGFEEALKSAYDLAVLDVMMPEMDGFSLAQKIKNEIPELSFIFLTAKSLKVDVLKGFYMGAVDYLKKPIDEEELVIRIENLLSRMVVSGENENIEPAIYKLGNYTFYPLNQELIIGGSTIILTVKESTLLSYFLERLNMLCPHKDILINIWGKNDYFNKKSLNVFITRLRKYLGRDPRIKIKNVHNKGYILRYQK